ncbi:uncharacterized protein [Musca autumnalis]|uniref:uncharacterized protein n=1 Tax=Musca autumnalis TaxID=221902 RepID=UPI003CF63A5A
MAKFMQILFVAFLAVALVAAEPKRHQGRRNRFLARQEVEEPITPYPSADELKPEVPFDESVAAEGQIPFTSVAAEGETTVFTEEETPFIPDEVYGPPEEEEFPVTQQDFAPVDEDNVVVSEEELIPARLLARRAGARKIAARPAKLRKPLRARSAKLRKVHNAH